MYDTFIDFMFLDTLDRRGSGHALYASSGSDMYHGHHQYHPYTRSDRGYLLDEFKKSNPPTFDGEFKNSEDAKAWLLGMKKLFELHDYTENMKAIITIFSLKGKEDIWREDVKWVRDIRIECLGWNEFKRLFKKKYLLERYYESKAKEFYVLKMG